MSIHTYPVPYGYTPEEAWEEISVLGELHRYRRWSWRQWWPFRQWAVMEVDD